MPQELRETNKLLREYSALAPDYDQRWSTYLATSLRMTTDLCAGLPANNVLDVGCGTGQLLEMLAGHPDKPTLSGIDQVPAMLAIAHERIGHQATLLQGAAENLPFDDGTFELVVSTNALHYFSDASTALREMRRVMTPTGNLVITDWCRDYILMRALNRILPRTQHAHAHTFSLSELQRSLAEADFRLVTSNRSKISWFWGLMNVHASAA